MLSMGWEWITGYPEVILVVCPSVDVRDIVL